MVHKNAEAIRFFCTDLDFLSINRAIRMPAVKDRGHQKDLRRCFYFFNPIGSSETASFQTAGMVCDGFNNGDYYEN